MSIDLSAPVAPIVSFDDEPLVLVDAHDQDVGFLDKAACHDGAGVLHRAFSLFVFNGRCELLLQRRSAQKRLWPTWWSNSCCSHPRRGETLDQAVRRRAQEELECTATMHYTHKFEYHAPFGPAGSEHELCHVYVGATSQPVRVNANEVAEVAWVGAEALDEALAQGDAHNRYTPWLRLEWAALRAHHWSKIEALVAQNCA